MSSVVSKESMSANDVTGNAPDPTLKFPPIVLSGVLDKDSLEYDPTGAPYYKFPPFVTTTIAKSNGGSDAPLIPFSAFKPYGLQIMLDVDEEEVDGNGIKTVQLGVKHVGKKKKKTRQKLDVTFQRRVMWWEDWEEGEHLRRGDVSDINVPRIDRFIQAAADFQRNRKWTPILQSVYDNFAQFAGLSVKTNPPIGKGFGSAKKRSQQGEDEMDLDDDDDEAEFAEAAQADDLNTNAAGVSPLHDPQEARIQELMAERDAELERRELRIQAFLDETDLRMKIFFSSFYKNKGLFWSEPKLRDGPILLRFFFNFIIRNKLMRDYDRVFQKGLAVVERAAIELPLTTRISRAIPDEFGNACVALWGKQMVEIAEKERQKTLETRAAEKKENEVPVAELDSFSSDEPTAPSATPETTWGDPFGSQKASLDPSSAPFEIPPQWGVTDSSSPAANLQPDEVDPWNPISTAEADWALPPPPSLMSLMNGPVSLPCTHEVKLVEKSTRRVVSIELPSDEVDERSKGKSFLGGFGKVRLAPWDRNPSLNGYTPGFGQKIGETSILPPELYIINPSSSSAGDNDPTKQTIDVYISPSSVSLLRDATGMGLYAVLVKVGLREPEKKEESPASTPAPASAPTPAEASTTSSGSGGPKKKKKSSKPGHSSNPNSNQDSEFWYIEFLYEVTPSFWIESDEGIDDAGGSDED